MLENHPGAQPAICPICGLGFKHKKSLSNHRNKQHSAGGPRQEVQKPKSCPVCGKVFAAALWSPTAQADEPALESGRGLLVEVQSLSFSLS